MCVSAVTPGPNNLMCLYLGATRGIKGSLRYMAGSMTGVFVKILLCGLLNVLLAETVPALVPYLKWIGAAYMIYLAISMIIDGFRKDEEGEERKDGKGTFMSGILLQCLNIKSWISSISIFSVYIIPHTTAIPVILTASVVYLGTLLVSSIIWCLFGQAIQKLFKEHKAVISLLMGLSLIFCAYTAIA